MNKKSVKLFNKIFLDLKNNYKIFIVCFFISLFLFYFINSLKYDYHIVFSDLNYINLNNKYIVEETDKKIKIYYRGKKDDLNYLNFYQMKPYVDLSKIKEGENLLKINFPYSYLPDGVKIVRIEPEYIKIFADLRIIKELKVNFNILNNPQEGYIISDIILNSNYVKVEGPKSILSNLSTLECNDIDISGIESSQIFKLEPKNRNLKIIFPESLYVQIEIKKQYEFFSFENIFVELLNKKDQFEYIVYPDSIKVTILVPLNLKNEFKIPRIKIDLSFFYEEGEYFIIPFLDINENYEIIDISPEKVLLKIIKTNKR